MNRPNSPLRPRSATRARLPWSSCSREQLLLGGVTGLGLLTFLLSNFSPSISLSIAGIVSQPLPLVVWMTLAGVAGSVTALVFQSLYQSLVSPIQVTRPRARRNGGVAGDRPGTWAAQVGEPWDEDELRDWVEGRSQSAGSPAWEEEMDPEEMGGSPWQRVAAASMGARDPAPRDQADRNQARPPRSRTTPAMSTPTAFDRDAQVGGGWDDRPNTEDDWADLLDQVQAAQTADRPAAAAPGTASAPTAPDRRAANPNPPAPGDRPNIPAPAEPRDNPASRDRSAPDRLYEVQQPPAEQRRSGSVYSYTYRRASADRPPANPSPTPPPPRPPQRPPAYLNNPQAGQPDAIYDVDYRVIPPPQSPSEEPRPAAQPAPRSPQRPPNRPQRQSPAPPDPASPSRAARDDWDQDRSEDW